MKLLSLKKTRSILQSAYSWYKKRGQKLPPSELARMESQMISLEAAINAGNREKASSLAESLQQFTHTHCKKTLTDYLKEILVAILIALLLAVVVRQMWFELYEIPTGSMRPTFKEQDRVAVTKTPFGINLPLTPGHLLFDPSLVVRGGAITFTSEGIERLDEDTLFMGVIPYKKRLIKRMIGKPGDSLYFYGGKIYGVNAKGEPLTELIEAPWMQKGQHFELEHIPMIRFTGIVSPVNAKEVRFLQMNLPVGRLAINGNDIKGEVFDGKTWVKDDPLAQRTPHSTPQSYSDFFGMRNFAMARLLTAKELKAIHKIDAKNLPEGVLYLELSHHPSLTFPQPLVWQNSRHLIELDTLKSIIPLTQEHLDRIMDSMYTARLVFKNGRSTRYSPEALYFSSDSPLFKGVKDGTYEFYNGQLEQIGRGALTYASPKDHPLYSHDPSNVQKLFNMGIEGSLAFMPSPGNINMPSRYAYFREGDLYLLGAPILNKDDPALTEFLAREEQREADSSRSRPYTAFKDYGPPIKEGQYDVDFIRAFGVNVPDKHYLVLGDNHAMSGDSRAFGFVPEDNLQGAPSLIMWPVGSRFGFPWQAPYALLVAPRLIVWFVIALVAALWGWCHWRYLHRPIILHPRMGPSEN